MANDKKPGDEQKAKQKDQGALKDASEKKVQRFLFGKDTTEEDIERFLDMILGPKPEKRPDGEE